MNKDELLGKVDELEKKQSWNHLIDLPEDVKTRKYTKNSPGDNVVKWNRMKFIHKYIKDKSILDVGSNDGFFSCKFSEVGAKNVLGLDIDPIRIEKANFVKEVKGLNNVEFKNINIFDQNCGLQNSFDFVNCLGVLHRVNSPLQLLETISSFTTDFLILEFKYYQYDPFIKNVCWLEEHKEDGNYQDFNLPYFRLSMTAVESTLKQLGFKYIVSIKDYDSRGFVVASKKTNFDIQNQDINFLKKFKLYLGLLKRMTTGLFR